MREIVDGETVSGHREGPDFSYPEFLVHDGIGAGHGRFVCSIEAFHAARVNIRRNGVTELAIGHFQAGEPPVGLTITFGKVLYAPSRKLDTAD